MCGRRFLSILALVLLVLPAAPASAATTRAEQDRDYPDIIARAGTYAYDGATGEASGLVASRRYPGYYWMIQDPAAGVDRSALFALRFDHRSNVSTSAGSAP